MIVTPLPEYCGTSPNTKVDEDIDLACRGDERRSNRGFGTLPTTVVTATSGACAPISAAASSSVAAVRALMTTLTPSPASALAQAWPRPGAGRFDFGQNHPFMLFRAAVRGPACICPG
ncbi:hypothetical protein VVT58_11080 [Sphingobium sp. SJ10-10]|uniref:hypothetical protein n=1 Tax=Sphingobium sp. SJ10-10 TaxID=3114999 RepID=UPI002E1739BE|nr:hypothetical protein [Sphingobium sp. SJ10-10]